MAKKTTYIMVDKSGSMHDCDEHTRASAVNEALRQVMDTVLPEILAQKDADLDTYIAVLTFSTRGIEWVIPRTKMEDAIGIWRGIELSEFIGGTPTGAAIQKVIEDINGGSYGESDPDAVAPAIILISDGMPNDDYELALKAAERGDPNFCPDFRRANRIAIGIQVDADGRTSLEKFGHVTRSIAAQGYQPYYDCTDDNTQALIDIIKSATQGATLG